MPSMAAALMGRSLVGLRLRQRGPRPQRPQPRPTGVGASLHGALVVARVFAVGVVTCPTRDDRSVSRHRMNRERPRPVEIVEGVTPEVVVQALPAQSSPVALDVNELARVTGCPMSVHV